MVKDTNSSWSQIKAGTLLSLPTSSGVTVLCRDAQFQCFTLNLSSRLPCTSFHYILFYICLHFGYEKYYNHPERKSEIEIKNLDDTSDILVTCLGHTPPNFPWPLEMWTSNLTTLWYWTWMDGSHLSNKKKRFLNWVEIRKKSNITVKKLEQTKLNWFMMLMRTISNHEVN